MRFLVSGSSYSILILSVRNHAFLDLLFSLPVHFLLCSSTCNSSPQPCFVREYRFLDTCLTEECKCGERCINDWCFSSGNLWQLSLWGLCFFLIWISGQYMPQVTQSIDNFGLDWNVCTGVGLACDVREFLDPHNLNLQLALVIHFFLCLSTVISLISCDLLKYYVHYLMDCHQMIMCGHEYMRNEDGKWNIHHLIGFSRCL